MNQPPTTQPPPQPPFLQPVPGPTTPVQPPVVPQAVLDATAAIIAAQEPKVTNWLAVNQVAVAGALAVLPQLIPHLPSGYKDWGTVIIGIVSSFFAALMEPKKVKA